MNFSKTTKLHKPVGQMQFVAFENFTSAHYTKLQGKSCCYLSIMYMKINQRVQIDVNFDSACAICNLYSCLNFALVLQLGTLIT